MKSKASMEDACALFSSELGAKAVSRKLRVSPNTLRAWWEERFGREAVVARGLGQHRKAVQIAIRARIVPVVNGEKKCGHCAEVKPVAEFLTVRGKPGSWCLACNRAYPVRKKLVKERHRRKAAELLSMKNSPCLDCGRTYHPWCMEFDHTDATQKTKNVGQLKAGSKSRLLDEIAKCHLVCANCHRVRTQSRRPPPTTIRVKNREFLAKLKAHPCLDCGGTFPSVAMDFDHVRGTKKFGLSGAINRPRSLILTEVAKCELVCANCHRTRTHFRQGQE